MVTASTNGGKIRVATKRIEDPMPFFEKKHKLKPLVDEENRAADEKRMHNERSNIFIVI